MEDNKKSMSQALNDEELMQVSGGMLELDEGQALNNCIQHMLLDIRGIDNKFEALDMLNAQRNFYVYLYSPEIADKAIANVKQTLGF